MRLALRFPAAVLRLSLVLAAGACHSDATGPSGGASTYTITVRYVDGTQPSAAVAAAFTRAVTKWQQAITDSVGSAPLNLTAGLCDSVQPAVSETVKNVLVLVDIRDIPDTASGQAILGEAGPCIVRLPSHLPVFGMMVLNSGTLETVQNEGLLDAVIEHEIAHILGFGTVWKLDGLLQDAATADPWFSGGQAAAAFRAADPTFNGNVVPVEGSGQTGTALSHWRESVLTNELMTGFIDPLVDPLSRITIASMADIGYVVNLSAADAWPTGSGSVVARDGAPRLEAIVEPSAALRTPRFGLTAAGELVPLGSGH